ncbi:MAG: hypothetical protein J3R72DRAFT_444778 [Linnemannia gamsii]|nr:MAG: hypothetical protein J3R72DRAFT_444778 [Linnemannia gamsii]
MTVSGISSITSILLLFLFLSRYELYPRMMIVFSPRHSTAMTNSQYLNKCGYSTLTNSSCLLACDKLWFSLISLNALTYSLNCMLVYYRCSTFRVHCKLTYLDLAYMAG